MLSRRQQLAPRPLTQLLGSRLPLKLRRLLPLPRQKLHQNFSRIQQLCKTRWEMLIECFVAVC
uniref:Uncharacterized protein n=1 Tax=Arundo donax TaxID=35708 RepID=A0A0A9A246_ARUDO